MLKPGDPAPAGVILSSGIYSPTVGPESYATYFGEDASKLPQMSSIPGVCKSGIPLLVSTAELDPPHIQVQTVALLGEFFEVNQRLPKLVQVEGHNHFSVMFHIGTDETQLSDRLARFISTLA
jgi:triacylglycerol lipase